ncbi:MAG: xanthine dehydrogenase family protein subunit M [Acidobacteriota bacterium]
MYPAPFDYFRADSVEQALELLSEHDGAKLLAGGHSLIPMLKFRLAEPRVLIDIARISELKGISIDDDGISIGALTTHRELSSSETLRSECPLISEAASKIGDPQVRNRGTIGGNIAHADPASDLPAPLLALDATVHVRSQEGERSISIADFFVDLLATRLETSEVMTHLTIPRNGTGSGSAYLKMEHPASGYAVCGAAAVVSSGNPQRVSLALNGVTGTPRRMTAVEQALESTGLDDAEIDAAVDGHLEIQDPLSDTYASADFRAELARVWSKRAIKAARDRASR